MNTNKLATSKTVVAVLDLLIRQDLLRHIHPIINNWNGVDLWTDHKHSMGVRLTDEDGVIKVNIMENYGPIGISATFNHMPASVIVAVVASYI